MGNIYIYIYIYIYIHTCNYTICRSKRLHARCGETPNEQTQNSEFESKSFVNVGGGFP